MWNASEEPQGATVGRPPDAIVRAEETSEETCEENKNQLESLKEIMLKNKQSLKRKEEEVQEYAKRLSKIKSRAKLSRRSKETGSSSADTAGFVSKTDEATIGTVDDTIDDIGQAKTPKAKSSLLQRKLAENRKAFERRNKEITETKRVVEEKVEAIRQQLEEKSHPVTDVNVDQPSPVIPVSPFVIDVPDVPSASVHLTDLWQKDNTKIAMLNNKILELEATVVDLRENLKEKDSVIESKTKAVTLLSADLSMKGKTTLDTLEDTKDEMRAMQEHFVLLETSLKNKNDNLLRQLQDRDNKILQLEDALIRSNRQLGERKEAELANADFSRSTMDTLVETRDAMKGMQENFVLIETSLKSKIDHLLEQLQDREAKLNEANSKIHQLEAATGGESVATDSNLRLKIEELEKSNRLLRDEKHVLNQRITEMENEQLAAKERQQSEVDALLEKDNRIAELETLVEELGQTIETERSNTESKLHGEELDSESKEKVQQLTKELDDLNKSMIKMKAQHRSKMKHIRKQLDNFENVSDLNAELVRLANQVTLLEEEKGNLQLSLVDFDELKALTGDLQGRVTDLENKVVVQAAEIKTHVDAIAALEDQKLDLMQELHTVKQEVSALEAENAESENLRVTAEMKVVELEEQLDSLHKAQNVRKADAALMRVDRTEQEDSEATNKLAKIEEKNASDSGSTESFENLQVERNDLLLRTFEEDMPKKNAQESMLKLSKPGEKGSSAAADFAESFETIMSDAERTELRKTQEGSDIAMKLDRIEENRGSSDTGSTESFERIPGHNESITKIELLTQENHDLVVKLTKLEEKLERMKEIRDKAVETEAAETSADVDDHLARLIRENEELSSEVTKLRAQINEYMAVERPDSDQADDERSDDSVQRQRRSTTAEAQPDNSPKSSLDPSDELTQLRLVLAEKLGSATSFEIDAGFVKSRIDAIFQENTRMTERIASLEESNRALKENLERLMQENDDLKAKVDRLISEDDVRKAVEFEEQPEEVDGEKLSADEAQKIEEGKSITVAELDAEIRRCMRTIEERNNLVEELKTKLADKEEELRARVKEIADCSLSSETQVGNLQRELEDSLSAIEEWKYKCETMQESADALAAEKAIIEESFGVLEKANARLMEEARSRETAVNQLTAETKDTIQSLEIKLRDQVAFASLKEQQIMRMDKEVEQKDRDLRAALSELQNITIARDSFVNKVESYEAELKEKTDQIRNYEQMLTDLTNKTQTYDFEIDKLRLRLNETISVHAYDELMGKLRDTEAFVGRMRENIDRSETENREMSEKVINMKERIHELEREVSRKVEEANDLAAIKAHMEAQLAEYEATGKESEKHARELQDSLTNSTKYAETLRRELDDAYRMLELLKTKHAEDTEMQNRRLEDLLEESNAREKEVEYLRHALEEKEQKLRERNLAEEAKTALEAKIADLEGKLGESEQKALAQLEKMKKIAATLKKKTAVCQELESRVTELEEKWMTEKDEKEAKNKMIQEAENIMREKDDKIVDLERKFARAQEENSEALENMEKLAKEEATSLREEAVTLKKRLEEAEEEIERLRADIDRRSAEVSREKLEKENVLRDMEALTNEEIALKDEAMSLRKRLEEAEEEMSELRAEANRMSSDVGEQKLAREKLLADVERLATSEIELKNEVGLSRRRLEEAEEEINRLRSMLDDQRAEIAEEKRAREEILAEYESYEERITRENEQQQAVLDEAKENARELSVRMQVMEGEYVEQLALIKNLKTENGLLLSKRTQINEKLENVEKTSEEQRLLIDQLQKEIEKATTTTTTTTSKDSTTETSTQTTWTETEEDPRDESSSSTTTTTITTRLRPLSGDLHCDHCDQCQTLVQALEAKLQEREAEIENLDNELANSIGNFVQMRESLRYSDLMNNQTLRQNRTLEDLLLQYNALSSDHEEVKAKLQVALRENEQLGARIENLEATNTASRERVIAVEESLRAEKETSRLKISDLEAEVERLKGENQGATSSSVAPNTPKLFDASQIFGTTRTGDEASSSFLSGISAEQQFSEAEEQSRVRREVEEPLMTQDSAPSVEMEVDLGDDSWGGGWGEMTTEEHLPTIKPPSRSEEAQLRARINELQSQIDIVEAEKLQVVEESKAMQIRCAKLAKKLKEYKAHVDNLQQQQQQQQQLSRETKRSSNDLGGLDSAIEEALRSRIEEVEKALKDATEECKRATTEKEALAKRLEVIAAANERYMEFKERQDINIETLRIENKEFASKVESLERRLRELDADTAAPCDTTPPEEEVNPPTKESQSLNSAADAEKLKLEMDDLKAEMNALASENEQLQRLLEEHRTQSLLSIKSQAADDETMLQQRLEEMSSKNIELQNMLKESSAKYEEMEKEYKEKLLAVEERVSVATHELEAEVNELNQRLIESDSKALGLRADMDKVLAEKADLEGRMSGGQRLVTEERLSLMEQSLSEMTDLLNARVQEVADLKQELQQLYIVRQEMERQTEESVSELTMELNAKQLEWQAAMENERQANEEEAQKRLVELRAYREEIGKLRERLDESEKLAETLRVSLTEKNSNAVPLETFQAKVVEANSLQAEIEKLRDELGQAWKDLAKKEDELMTKREDPSSVVVGGSGGNPAEALFSDRPTTTGSTKIVDGLPVFTMLDGQDGSGDNYEMTIEKYKLEVEEKQQEIEHLRYVLSENTYPRILQEMQDTVNRLYDEKAQLELSLRETTHNLTEKHAEVENLKIQIERYEDPSRNRRLDGQEQRIVELQNELHVKEQELNDLRYVIAEKDSQLSFRASAEPSSDEFHQLRETVESLTNEVCNKDREIQCLESTERELRDQQLVRSRELERFVHEAREAQATLEETLRQKEMELEETKERMFAENQRLAEEVRSKEDQVETLKAQLEMLIADNRKYLEDIRNQDSQLQQMSAQMRYLAAENQKVLEDLRSKESQVESLRLQLDSLTTDSDEKLRQKEDELSRALIDLAEKERRLAELSITKDAELHDLKVKIHEKEVRIEELMALSEEEEKQLEELRKALDLREEEVEILRDQLEDKIKEYELIRSSSAAREISAEGASSSANCEQRASTSTELDLALYMLHQRDVRCEELTHELMQLLEERDTLQLRLSNAIKLNEELRRSSTSDLSPKKSPSPSSSAEDHSSSAEDHHHHHRPSHSKSDGPVEIAKEAIHDIPIGEDKEALAEKLSQLHTMGHTKDVRLRDDRELRHTQQMSLYAHRDVLSSLPPEAAARLVNANYTLSRDVQSQSSVLFNWLWGKSTPKVVHM